MVSRAYYESEEPVYSRHSGRRHGYPLSHERELPTSSGPYSSSRNHQLALQESRTSSQASDQDSTASLPRRRIPVACGRCRKRKIRCSGDPGNGGACSGCKAAGNDNCQFLRVLSTEAPMKNDTVDYYDSGPSASRIHCRMVPYGLQTYAPPPIPLGSDGFPYRHGSMSYPYPGKGYYGMPSYGEFTDENIDYGLQTGSYPLMGGESISMGPAYSSIGRGWTPATHLPKNNLLFLGEDSPYNHPQAPYTANGYGLRQAISPDSKGMSMTGISSSLPALAAGADRLLPMPPQRPLVRTNDSLPTRTLDGMPPYSSELLSTNVISNSKSINTNSASENASINSTYGALSQNSPQAGTAAHLNCSSQSLSANHQQTDMYNHSSSGRLYGSIATSSSDDLQSSSGGRIYDSIATSSSEDLQGGSYRVVSPGSKGPSHGSQADDFGPSQQGDLASGHRYVPHQQEVYPLPRLELQAPAAHRSSDTSIQAGA